MLEISDLRIAIAGRELVSIADLQLQPDTRLGLVGESGCGKTLTVRAIAGLQHRQASATGSIRFKGVEYLSMREKELARRRGRDIGFIAQDPFRALNPTKRVGRQVAEAIKLHRSGRAGDVRARVKALFTQVQLSRPEEMARRYPHQLSGGERQRVLISMAIACEPELLIADEPTTALDVTVQAEILALLRQLSDEHGMGLLLVSHDLGVVRAACTDVAVMYGGEIVEAGPVRDVIDHPRHRYTRALIGANPMLPSADAAAEMALGQPLQTIEGVVPSPGQFPSGCRFRDRCGYSVQRCEDLPQWSSGGYGHRYRCWNPAEEVS